MTVLDLLTTLRARDIELWVDGDQLRLNAPKGALTPELMQQLKANKAALLELLQAQTAEQAAPIPRIPRDQPLRLAPGQESLWQIAQLLPDVPQFNMYLAFRLQGQLDTDALATALRTLVARHESLRTTFPVGAENRPVLQIQPTAAWSLNYQTVPNVPVDQRHTHMQKAADSAAAQKLDVVNGPLFVTELHRYADDDHLLLITQHHIISDGWSHSILLQELATLYAAARADKNAGLAPALQFADYAAWRHDWLTDEAANTEREAALAALTPSPPSLTLPYDRPPSTGDYAGDVIVDVYDADLRQQARALAASASTTPFAVYLAALNGLLAIAGDQNDFVVAAPAAARERDELNSVVGYVNNTVVLRSQVTPTMTGRDLLNQTAATVRDTFTRQSYPFPQLIQEPTLSGIPLTRFAFNFRTVEGHDLELEGLDVTSIESFAPTSHVDIAFTIEERADEVRNLLGFKTALFDEATVQRVLDQYRAALIQLTTAPDAPLNDWPINRWPAPQHTPTITVSDDHDNTELERRLMLLWQELLQVPSVDRHDNFFALGGHSLLALQLFQRINAEFSLNLPLATLFQARTVAELAAAIAQSDGSQTWSSLIPIQPNGDKTPFFCIHGLTGDILWFRELGQQLAPDQPLFGIQSRGLDGVQAPLSSIGAMADFYLEAMRKVQPAGPYLIGGASFGGTVAIEMAHRLRQQDETVALLVMFDHAPFTTEISRGQQAMAFMRNLPGAIGETGRLGPRQLLDRVRRKLRVAGRDVSPDANADARDLIDYAGDLDPHRQQIIASNFAALASYTPPIYSGRMLLFRADIQPLTNPVGPEVAWPPDQTIIRVSGSHEGIFKDDNVARMAQALRQQIDAALQQA